ncbi:transposase [Streptomyces sp. NBC_00151]|uniref:transposase n=1 Tax=Streptomyces sp. NBC_00151 TaxID=2975669 RepID=UPI002DDA76CF|nr:transposase [Streptomyces sp. NBC_00151]WRZ37010.1 transposase [Streptomyces sp. NBC_00151]
MNQALSSASVLNRLMRIALPDRPTPRVAGIDEFALLKGHRYATIITNAETGERVEVLPDRRKDTVVAWAREHPGIRMLCWTAPAASPGPSVRPTRRLCRPSTAGTCGTA